MHADGYKRFECFELLQLILVLSDFGLGFLQFALDSVQLPHGHHLRIFSCHWQSGKIFNFFSELINLFNNNGLGVYIAFA